MKARVVGYALVAFLAAGVAAAQSSREIVARVREVTSSWPAGQPPSDEAALRSAISRLGEAALAFIALSDRTAQQGEESRERAALLEAYRALVQPLEAIYEQTGGKLEKMVRKVIEEDGDLEALYDSPEYRRAGSLGAQALYYLNWVRFYGARLADPAQRKALLEKALSGFGEFASSENAELRRESLLGRGLCALELGDLDAARQDLLAVAEDPQNPPERRVRARLALLDAYTRNARYREAAELAAAMLQAGINDPRVRFLRARALLEMARKASGTESERLRKEALAALDPLQRGGGVWAERAQALLLANADDPARLAKEATTPRTRLEAAKLLLQKKDYPQAIAALEEIAKQGTALPPALEAERSYLLGLALFQTSQWQAAATALEFASKHKEGDDAAEAAYLRFKAWERIAAEQGEQADHAAYEAAVRDYTRRFPEHRFAYEAWFRLGEILQQQKRCKEAVEAYQRVSGDREFTVRARFGTLQCRIQELAESGAPNSQAAAEIGDEIAILTRALAELEKRPQNEAGFLAGLQAKLVLIRAVWQSWQAQPDWQAIASSLEGFEQRFPQQPELFPAVNRLRLLALLRLGRFAEAEAVSQRWANALVQEYGPSAIEELAVAFIRAGTQRKNQGEAGADLAAQRVALPLYQALASKEDRRLQLRLTLARLYENTGAEEPARALYEQILADEPEALAPLRALARIAESRGDLDGARQYWERYARAARPGDAPWYEGAYQLARLEHAKGETRAACARLEQLKPAMPGLSDAELRQQLDSLYRQACR